MNACTAITVINVALIALIGFGIYLTHICWPLIGLMFMMAAKTGGSDD